MRVVKVAVGLVRFLDSAEEPIRLKYEFDKDHPYTFGENQNGLYAILERKILRDFHARTFHFPKQGDFQPNPCGSSFLLFEASSSFSSRWVEVCSAGIFGPFGSAGSSLGSSAETFSLPVPASVSPAAPPAIRTGVAQDHSAHYDFSVPSGRETSAPNLSHGQQGSASQGRCEQRSVSEIHASRARRALSALAAPDSGRVVVEFRSLE
jgi:hypothetical protein